MQLNAKEVNSVHPAFWFQQHTVLAICKGQQSLQDVIWNAFPMIISKTFVPALLPLVLVLSAQLVAAAVSSGTCTSC